MVKQVCLHRSSGTAAGWPSATTVITPTTTPAIPDVAHAYPSARSRLVVVRSAASWRSVTVSWLVMGTPEVEDWVGAHRRRHRAAAAPGAAPDPGRVLARLSAGACSATITVVHAPGIRPVPGAVLAVAVVLAGVSVPLSAGLEGIHDTVFYAVDSVVLALAGALISSRRRANPIGWILLAMGLEAAVVEVAEGYGYHGSYPGAVFSGWVASWGSLLGAGTTATVLALFPTGSPATRRWRPVVWAAITGTVLLVVGTAFGHAADDVFGSGTNPYAVDSGWVDAVYTAGQVVFSVALLAAVASLFTRFRRSAGIERQQLKWIAVVGCALAVVGPLAIAFYFDSLVVQIAIAVVVTAWPVAVCVAVLRYRLYDIDVIINRTVVYGPGEHVGRDLLRAHGVGPRHGRGPVGVRPGSPPVRRSPPSLSSTR